MGLDIASSVLPNFDTATISLHSPQIGHAVAPAAHAILVPDDAGCQGRAKYLQAVRSRRG